MLETKWLKTLREKYLAGISNLFIITGNINDYPAPNYLFKDYLRQGLANLGIKDSYTISVASNVPEQYHDMMHYLESIVYAQDTKRAVIVEYPEFIFPSTPLENLSKGSASDYVRLMSIINDKRFINSNNVIVFLTESKYSINQKLLGANTRSYLLEAGFPSDRERLEYLKFLKLTSKKEINYEVSLEEFARITAGLTLVGIEDIYLQGEMIGSLKKSFVIERKTELINKEYGEVLEVLDSDKYSFDDFAGHEHLKKYHREVIIEPMLSGDVRIVPKGVLYTGPPGTGKTHFARCLSGEAGINFVELKMSKILDKWVGESEKRFEKALTCIKSIAPVGVFIDEIDQAFSRGDGESNSVNKNLFGMFLTVLSDPENRGNIIWVGACNYPNKLDDALKRTGRFDKKIPFLPPGKVDRVRTLQVHLDRADFKVSIEKKELEYLSSELDGYTQAEIEGVVIKALELSLRKKKDEISIKELIEAVDTVVSSSGEKIDEMIEIAVKECNDREFLPEGYLT